MSISEKAKEFDKSGEHRRDLDNALKLLRQFRQKYPFIDDPEQIERLTADARALRNVQKLIKA